MKKEEHSLEDCFEAVHNNLCYLPDKFCYWKKDSVGGRKVSKSLHSDYRPIFSFMDDYELHDNLADLRMCLDYHRSIFELLKPGLNFAWQHKIVMYQMAGAIYEGLLLDRLNHEAQKTEGVAKVTLVERINGKGNGCLGLGGLLDLYTKAKLLDKEWLKYLTNVNHLRNTIHPRLYGYNKLISYKENPLIKDSLDNLFTRLGDFVVLIKKQY